MKYLLVLILIFGLFSCSNEENKNINIKNVNLENINDINWGDNKLSDIEKNWLYFIKSLFEWDCDTFLNFLNDNKYFWVEYNKYVDYSRLLKNEWKEKVCKIFQENVKFNNSFEDYLNNYEYKIFTYDDYLNWNIYISNEAETLWFNYFNTGSYLFVWNIIKDWKDDFLNNNKKLKDIFNIVVSKNNWKYYVNATLIKVFIKNDNYNEINNESDKIFWNEWDEENWWYKQKDKKIYRCTSWKTILKCYFITKEYKSFKLLDYWYAKNAYEVFDSWLINFFADIDTFKVINNEYTKDKYNCYSARKIVNIDECTN